MTKYYKPVGQKYLSLKGVSYPVGHVIITSDNTNPGTYMDGTWTLIDKKFTTKKFTANSTPAWYTINTTNTNSASCYAIRSGNTITMEFIIYNKVNVTDSAIQWLTLNYSQLGVSKLETAQYVVFYSDGGDGIVYVTMYGDDGIIQSTDVMVRGSTGAMPANNNFRGAFSFCVPYYDMLDSACDEFHWQRTA